MTLRFLSPNEPLEHGIPDEINENSLVVMLEFGKRRILFMGDAGAQAEGKLLASGVDLHADVLKVGHHGSAYASTPAFVRAVAPSIAVISVGRENLFGHPAPSTLETLERAGTRVYRTDRDGAVTITTDGDRIDAVPFIAAPR